MDMKKIEPWADFFTELSDAKSSEIYFLLKDLTVPKNTPLFEQGSYGDRLYFIRSGRLVLTYYDNDKKKDMEVAILEKGDIAGLDNFFSFTTHTVTLTALKESEILYLERSDFEKILEDNPLAETILFGYCKTYEKEYQIKSTEGRARRVHERFPLFMDAYVQILDEEGNLTGDSTHVTIEDLSIGGLSFVLYNIEKDDAASFYESWINLTASYVEGSAEKDVDKDAKVVSVRVLPFGKARVHVQFREPLDTNKVEEIIFYSDKAV
jgi:CRP-like cAMP-binding protein